MTKSLPNTTVQASSNTDESPVNLGGIVRTFWGAVESGDASAAADMLTEDVAWDVMYLGHLMPCDGKYRGKAQVRMDLLEIIPKVFYVPGQTKFDITDMYIADPVVVVEMTINAVTVKGRSMEDAKYISVITLENGKIKSIREYPDALKAKAAHLD
jgi:ketosteroid isomerase-like protein